MSAYLVVSITAHTYDWLPAYLSNVPAIVRSFRGKYLAISKAEPKAVVVIEGDAPSPDGMVVFEFPSMEAIESFVKSPEYAPFRKARNAETESVFFAFENDDNAPQFAGHERRA